MRNVQGSNAEVVYEYAPGEILQVSEVAQDEHGEYKAHTIDGGWVPLSELAAAAHDSPWTPADRVQGRLSFQDDLQEGVPPV